MKKVGEELFELIREDIGTEENELIFEQSGRDTVSVVAMHFVVDIRFGF